MVNGNKELIEFDVKCVRNILGKIILLYIDDYIYKLINCFFKNCCKGRGVLL